MGGGGKGRVRAGCGCAEPGSALQPVACCLALYTAVVAQCCIMEYNLASLLCCFHGRQALYVSWRAGSVCVMAPRCLLYLVRQLLMRAELVCCKRSVREGCACGCTLPMLQKSHCCVGVHACAWGWE